LLAAYKAPDHAVLEIIERDDGLIDTSRGPQRYFSSYGSWTRREQQAIQAASGRVLDIGCGAGRFALYLQGKGLDVTAIDNSPGAIKVCKLRGVRKVKLQSITEVGKFEPRSFDSVILMGNNFGLCGSLRRARHLLRKLFRVITDQGRIIAETTDPYGTREPLHLRYQRFNRRRGRMSGQLRLRVRHGTTIGPWFDYLLVSRQEMRKIIARTGWRIERILSDKGPGYIVILKKSKKGAVKGA
jgi:SAM-dependent methyltransferase